MVVNFAQPAVVGNGGLVSLHDSVGERQLIIDLADRLNVPLTELQNTTLNQLKGLLDPGLPAVNPLDGWGAGGADAPIRMAACFTTLLMDSGAAFGAVVHDRGPNSEIYGSYLDYLHQAQSATSKPVFLVANRQGSGSDELAVTSTHQGFPVIDGVSQFLVGARCLLNYRDFQQREPSQINDLDQDKCEYWRGRLRDEIKVSETLASQCLADLGIPMLQGVLVSSQDALRSAATRLGFPGVLKTAQPSIEHKSDVDGVILNIINETQLLDAYGDMAERLGSEAMIAPMVYSDGVEMILGVSRDDQFGPVVVVGFGGIYAEVLDDVTVLIPPFDAAAVKRALQNLAMYELLSGVRGSSKLDVDSYCEAAEKISLFALLFADTVAEVDINPIKVTADGCIGLDALMVLTD